MPSADIRLGPFVLSAPLGEGGMGQVWAGVHASLGLPVAVKVVHGDRHDDPAYQRAFRTEVRAMAGLDHPNVVRVLDTAVVPPEAARASAGRLRAGANYFVMERVGSDLDAHLDRLDWRRTRDITREVLRGLAHAHARGVLHRDLKPANLLVDPQGTVKLTDFGLAQLRRTDAAPEAAGTPSYMAPEQLTGRWRAAGPWTDLYSLGAVVWEMVCGGPPYGRVGRADALRAHTVLPLPALVPRYEVPSGLEGWLRRLLAKGEGDRYRRCADALLGLDEVDRVRRWIPTGAVGIVAHDPDEVPTELQRDDGPPGGGTEVLDDDDDDLFEPTAWTAPLPTDGARPMPVVHPPPPPEPPRDPPSPPPLLGAGLGLVAQRRPPLVGRADAQQALWGALREVHRGGHAHGLVLTGGAGLGKTRLAEWLLEAAHASGAAHTWRLQVQGDGGTAPVAALLAEVLGAEGCADDALRDHLREALARHGVSDRLDAVLQHLAPREGAEPPDPRVGFGLIDRLLAHATATRPVVLLLDDAVLSRQALQLTRYLVRGPGRHRSVLVVLTADDEHLVEIPPARAALDQLLAGPRMEGLPIAPLPRDAHRELVRSLVGAGSPLVDRVVALTGGHPLFAVQLVRSWTEEGSMRAVEGGYALDADARRGLPPDLARVWMRRLRFALRERPSAQRHTLEMAAVLGDPVALDEWQAACEVLHLPPPADLLEPLLDAGILVRGPEGAAHPTVAFRHRMLREAALDGVRASQVGPRLHAAAAAVLRTGGRSRAGRRGRHLLAAGHARDAIEPLLEGARHALRHGEPTAESLLDDAAHALARAHIPAHDRRWGDLLLARDGLARLRLDGRALEACALEVMAAAERHGWADVALRGTRSLASAYRLQGRHLDALPLLMAARAMARADGDEAQEILLGMERVHVLTELGRLAEAQALLVEALESPADHPTLRTRLALHLTLVHLGAGRDAAAQTARDDLAPWIEAHGAPLHHARLLVLDGDLHRRAGRRPAAEAAYQAARRRYLHLGHDAHALLPMVGLVHLRNDENRFREAAALGTEVLHAYRARGLVLGELAAHGARLPSLAAIGHWSAFDRSLTALVERTRHPGLAHADLVGALEQAAAFARQTGRGLRAKTAATVAATHRARLG